MNLKFKGDTVAEVIKSRLSKCIKLSFHAADLHLVFTNRYMIGQCVKDKLPLMSTSMCIYSFECLCKHDDIACCKRVLWKRVAEHHPVWLMKGEYRTTKSSICEYLLESGHSAAPTHVICPLKSTGQNRTTPKSFFFSTFAYLKLQKHMCSKTSCSTPFFTLDILIFFYFIIWYSVDNGINEKESH
uniref:Uncharacterized protein n=1 Tax=Trichobilharzia regenti TaxID=157069 RepID=A0AA85JHM0_TRIRE|nr:unnamed protein product [Trichobilharzia regenti]